MIHILLVEDNDGDVLLTREALEEAQVVTKLSIAKDGQEAIDFLNKPDGRETRSPDLILLDINLPKVNGFEVLKYIKEDPRWKHIPVIMLTTSSAQKDIDKAYNGYANCYITKPVDVSDFLSVITTIESFWISIAKLPTHKSA